VGESTVHGLIRPPQSIRNLLRREDGNFESLGDFDEKARTPNNALPFMDNIQKRHLKIDDDENVG
jgi:hypothetical protein